MHTIYETVHKATYEYPYISVENHIGNFRLHFHEEIEVLYMLQGSIIVTLGMQNKMLYPGDICLITPDTAHTLVPTGHNRMLISKIYPHIDLSQIRLAKDIFQSDDPEYAFLHECITTMIREDLERQPGYDLAVSVAAGQILLFLQRRLAHIQTQGIAINKREHIFQFINTVNTFLEKNYQRKISLEEIAQHCNYSKCYFSKLFMRLTGIHFNDYYTFFRVSKSVNLLRDTNLSIDQIALLCGFFNVRSYNMAFQKHFQNNPREYRRIIRSISTKSAPVPFSTIQDDENCTD